MSTLVGVLTTLKDQYIDMVNNEDIPVLNKIMAPIIAGLAVVSVLSAIIGYIYLWVIATMFIFIMHGVAGLAILIGLFAKAMGCEF